MTARRGATLATLRRRAAVLAKIREFFAARDVLEVETPTLSLAGVSDPNIDSVTVEIRGVTHYLHTSPEFAMKRLLADGSGDIFQICRVYRDGELGRWHLPEFTMLEWYRVGWDEHALMDEVAELINSVLGVPRVVARLRYTRAFEQALGCDPFADAGVRDRLTARGIDVPDGLERDGLLDLAMSAVVVPSFDPGALTFVHDYPATQAALAEINADDARVAARFEAFSGGIELGNGFRELRDAAEQRRRFELELARRRTLRRRVPPVDEAFLSALSRLPRCAGVAIGIDRLIALDCGLEELGRCVSFALK